MLATTNAGLASESAHDHHAAPLQVQLPAEMLDYFVESGYLGSVYGEQRSTARLRVRCQAIRESQFVPPFARNRTPVAKVLMKDMSRCGIGLLSHEQLWPGETFWVALMARRILVRVVRCRRLGPHCFEVGGVVLEV